VQERRHALAGRELDEGRPVDGRGRERRQLGIRGGVWTAPRAEQEQSRVRAQRGAHGHGGYDVVLVRFPLPMLVRCAVLHVPLVARQHVVVSAPKILLGSSVGFS
jgi:hypothetical protein